MLEDGLLSLNMEESENNTYIQAMKRNQWGYLQISSNKFDQYNS
jgi:hypothetical protein